MVDLFLGSVLFSLGRSLPSTSSKQNRIPDRPQYIVWYSFPNGWGFRGQNTHPGHVHRLVQMDIDLSKQLIQPELKILFMFVLKDLSSCCTSHIRSLYAGGGWLGEHQFCCDLLKSSSCHEIVYTIGRSPLPADRSRRPKLSTVHWSSRCVCEEEPYS